MKTAHSLDQLPWTNDFLELGDEFYSTVTATPLRKPYWVHINAAVAQHIGLSATTLRTDNNLAIFSGAKSITSSTKEIPTVAMVYAGHQFGGFSPQLGDGRGLLIGQLALEDGRLDLHLKGAGKTPYSRFGDGRAVLRSSIREYLAGEAMHHLGIPSSRALCITASQDPVARETIETAAMVTRTARTHIRFGHFEYFHTQRQFDQVKQLADHVIAQFLPEQLGQDDRYCELLRYTVKQTARMIAKWQSVGFAHGVMNTDNMSIIGETIDYGPYGFLDDYEPEFICNHSDDTGRYAFDQQPTIGLWNLNVLAHALSSLIEKDHIVKILSEYEPTIVEHYSGLMRAKLGLSTQQKEDYTLCAKLLHIMEKDRVDYTLLFRRLCDFTIDSDNAAIASLFQQQDEFNEWQQAYKDRLQQETDCEETRQNKMKRVNPKFILRNYLLQAAIEKAQNNADFSEIDRLMTLIQSPFDEHPEYESYASPPPEWGKHLAISCSS